jgi:dihydrofolate reductase
VCELLSMGRPSARHTAVITYGVSMSLDDCVAGKGQGPKHPPGTRGEHLHEWMRELAAWRKLAGLKGGITNASTKVFLEEDRSIGAIIMGRNMFGGGPGPWGTPSWNGWWGDDPPFHLPVFVLTHHRRESLVCKGGTTFHFVTKGITAARRLAEDAAGGKDVALSGGAGTAKQFIEGGLVDEIAIHPVPGLLGEGVRLFDHRLLSKVRLVQTRAVEAPGGTHLSYRVIGRPSTRRGK